MGLGKYRNKPCRCGSWDKYKDCHLNRDDGEIIKVREVDKLIRKNYSKRKCMVPDQLRHKCTKKIISAHTVSKSSNLKLIQRDWHVYSYKWSISKLQENGGSPKFELVWINEASTFYWFCDFHDSKLFEPIEKYPLTLTMEQLFLLSYRVLAKEVYNKYGVLDFFKENSDLDKGRAPLEQLDIQQFLQTFSIWTELAINDLNKILVTYNNSLINQSYEPDNYVYYYMILDSTPPIMCWWSVFPHYNFEWQLIQDIGDLEIDLDEVALNSISMPDNKWAFIFFARKTSSAIAFLESFDRIPSNLKIPTFIKFLFSYSENIFIKPDWWDNLAENSKNILKLSQAKAIHDIPSPTDIEPQNIEGVPLNIESIESNLI